MAGLKDMIPPEKKVEAGASPGRGGKEEDKNIKLLTSLISAESKVSEEDRRILRELELLIEEDFLNLVKVDECPRSAKIYADLQDVFEDLVNVFSFPGLENTSTVAVGGQFSTGKSKFLNAILGGEALLPTATEPTTAIPTYIFQAPEDAIYALNRHQHKVPLDEEGLKAISHGFKKKYNVSFSHILKLITVEKANFKWKNITLLDTPGYSKSDNKSSRYDNTDESIAHSHLRTADFLVWLIDIQNGTIPRADMDFIENMDYQRPILFVFNKADKKPESEVFKILEKAEADLKESGIPSQGVIAYSAEKKKEYSASGDVFYKCMEEIESQTPGTEILKRCQRVFDEYLSYHKTEIEALRLDRKVLNDGSLLSGSGDEFRSVLKEIARRHKGKIDNLLESEKKVRAIQEQFEEKIRELLASLNIPVLEDKALSLASRPSEDLQLYRLKAVFQCRQVDVLSKSHNLKEIPGEVTGVNSSQVTFKTPGEGKGLIRDSEIKKEINKKPSEVFQEGDRIKVQYLDKNSCIVEVEI